MRQKSLSSFSVLLAFAAGSTVGLSAQQHPDRIFVNAKVWTGDDTRPEVEAFSVRGDKIVAVGSTAEIRASAGPETSVVDLRRDRVVPGFEDSHVHFPGPPVDRVNLSGVETLEEFQHRVAEFVKTHPRVEFVIGNGWGYSVFPSSKPDKKYLDAVVADRPVYLVERDGHMGLANSKALALAGVNKNTADPPNGRIQRDTNGEPTGELQEAAQDFVFEKVPASTDEESYEALIQHMGEAASYGITAVTQAGWNPELQRLVLRALAAGQLKIRFHMAPVILPNEGMAPESHKLKIPLTAKDLTAYRELRDTFRGPLIEFGAIKGMLDGTVDAKTAAMFDPYVGGGTGIPFWEQDDLNQTVALYDREGYQVMLHAIGDKAIHMALDAFEYAEKTNGTSGRRHRVEHVEVPLLADLPRFQQLGVIASTHRRCSPTQTQLLWETSLRTLGPSAPSMPTPSEFSTMPVPYRHSEATGRFSLTKCCRRFSAR